jgi:hypothetical protein
MINVIKESLDFQSSHEHPLVVPTVHCFVLLEPASSKFLDNDGIRPSPIH